MLNKKIKKILIGSNNPGKVKEIRDLLPKSVNIFSIKDFKIKSPIENGKSFEENSLIKAKFFSKKTKMICLADDSGLEIDILGGAPGIYSARWGGKKNNFNKAINKVFKQINVLRTGYALTPLIANWLERLFISCCSKTCIRI